MPESKAAGALELIRVVANLCIDNGKSYPALRRRPVIHRYVTRRKSIAII
jgi:hypothetical protein